MRYPFAFGEVPLSFLMRSFYRQFVLVVAAVAGLGITCGSLCAAESQANQSSLNDGYSLFYHFCDQESRLSLLLWVKTAPSDIIAYAKRISSTAKEDMAILNKFSASDKALRLDKISLPAFELEVRKSMDEDRQQQLVWGSSGAALGVRSA